MDLTVIILYSVLFAGFIILQFLHYFELQKMRKEMLDREKIWIDERNGMILKFIAISEKDHAEIFKIEQKRLDIQEIAIKTNDKHMDYINKPYETEYERQKRVDELRLQALADIEKRKKEYENIVETT